MSNEQQPEPTPAKTLGVLAEFAGPDELVEAAAKTTDSGYRRVEAFSPFPIHGIDDALKSHGTILPWLVFCCGLAGCLTALAMQYYMNATEEWWPFSGYQYAISGKPYFSLPANIPVTFELIVLFSAFGAFFGMWALNGLPRLSNPLFKSERFQTATSHGFFLWIDAQDAKFSEGDSSAYLESIGASGVEPVVEETEGHDVPGLILIVGAVMTCFALVPPFFVAAAAGKSSQPRLSIWWCMDYQPKYKAQTTVLDPQKPLFADGRSMRKPVEGTVPRGGLRDDLRYYRGLNSEELMTAEADGPNDDGPNTDGPKVQFVNLLQEDAAAAADPLKDWATDFPEQFEITAEAMDRGQQRYNIYCATCHGVDGLGQGLITRRARAIESPTWTQPTSFYTEDVINQPHGKLFETISEGRRKMPGYATQITVEDRWAIVLYVRALQKQRESVPAEQPEENAN